MLRDGAFFLFLLVSSRMGVGAACALSAMVARCREIETPDEKNFIFRDRTFALRRAMEI
jgi:hypothetical protein